MLVTHRESDDGFSGVFPVHVGGALCLFSAAVHGAGLYDAVVVGEDAGGPQGVGYSGSEDHACGERDERQAHWSSPSRYSHGLLVNRSITPNPVTAMKMVIIGSVWGKRNHVKMAAAPLPRVMSSTYR